LCMNSMITDLANEIIIWSRLSYPNIVRFLGVTKDLWLVMEYMEFGTLTSVITSMYEDENKAKLKLTMTEIIQLMTEAACGLDFIHSRGIVHCDISPNNIMITGSTSHPEAKIADFGISHKAGVSRDRKGAGTPPYSAPEVLSGEGHTTKSDVYSFGLTLWFACCGKEPYPDAENKFDYHRIVCDQGKRPEPLEDEGIQKIVSACWDADPNIRPSMTDVVGALTEYLRISDKNEEPSEVDSLMSESSTEDEESTSEGSEYYDNDDDNNSDSYSNNDNDEGVDGNDQITYPNEAMSL